ncbi:hypothetical protein [Citromicrobium bathyomarinum]|uniref:hypothetical protein n=1 Tax=Citromicrobium bathyomarinum TaxID=72174 RepID=UPI00315B326B
MTPQKRTRMYLTSAVMGFVATILYILAATLDWPDFIRGLSIGVLLVSLLMLLLRRMRDEYIEQLWSAGTGLAFAAVVVIFLAAPFVEGFVDGFNGSIRDQAITADFVGPAALLAFFVGFHIKWLRSSL